MNTTDTVLGFGWTGLIHPDDLTSVLAHGLPLLEKAQAFEGKCRFRFRTSSQPRDGYQWVAYSLVPIKTADGNVDSMLGHLRILTKPEEEAAVSTDKQWIRCLNSSRNHPLMVSTVMVDVDSVFANTTQYLLDLAGEAGIPISPTLSWEDQQFPLMPLQCVTCPRTPTHGVVDPSTAARLLANMRQQPYAWLDVSPYPEVQPQDFEQIEEDLQELKYAVYFSATRFFLNAVDRTCDPRVLTHNWLNNHGIKSQLSVVADVCYSQRANLARLVGCDYYLGDDPDVVLDAYDMGVSAYLIDRPWNRHANIPFRVKSFAEFLDRTVYAGGYTNKD